MTEALVLHVVAEPVPGEDHHRWTVSGSGFSASVVLCGCGRPPAGLYERVEQGVATRVHLARCPAGHLHPPQFEELVKRLVASFGGPRRVTVVREDA